jgi:thiamine monophosphate kinase
MSNEPHNKIEKKKEVGESRLKSGEDHHLMICLSKEDLIKRKSEFRYSKY